MHRNTKQCGDHCENSLPSQPSAGQSRGGAILQLRCGRREDADPSQPRGGRCEKGKRPNRDVIIEKGLPRVMMDSALVHLGRDRGRNGGAIGAAEILGQERIRKNDFPDEPSPSVPLTLFAFFKNLEIRRISTALTKMKLRSQLRIYQRGLFFRYWSPVAPLSNSDAENGARLLPIKLDCSAR